jgi:hypothetical protein
LERARTASDHVDKVIGSFRTTFSSLRRFASRRLGADFANAKAVTKQNVFWAERTREDQNRGASLRATKRKLRVVRSKNRDARLKVRAEARTFNLFCAPIKLLE